MTRTPNILIVDDHREIRDALKRYLERNGFRASAVDSTKAMDKAMAESRFDLVVLDIMMPGEDGLSACRRLRIENDVAVLMLTALGEDTDRIVGLELGADDYLAKPFNPREVVARIKAILRRT
ncbi:MAG: response regulator, partial [Oceanibaculum sp.]